MLTFHLSQKNKEAVYKFRNFSFMIPQAKISDDCERGASYPGNMKCKMDFVDSLEIFDKQQLVESVMNERRIKKREPKTKSVKVYIPSSLEWFDMSRDYIKLVRNCFKKSRHLELQN